MPHPMQPIEKDATGIYRFKENRIVSFLAREVLDLNQILKIHYVNPFPQEDWEQLLQLMGYSVSGYGDYLQTNLVSVASVNQADCIVNAMISDEKVEKIRSQST